jgi:hypothetical protein
MVHITVSSGERQISRRKMSFLTGIEKSNSGSKPTKGQQDGVIARVVLGSLAIE